MQKCMRRNREIPASWKSVENEFSSDYHIYHILQPEQNVFRPQIAFPTEPKFDIIKEPAVRFPSAFSLINDFPAGTFNVWAELKNLRLGWSLILMAFPRRLCFRQSMTC